jgi:hypothetical protein
MVCLKTTENPLYSRMEGVYGFIIVSFVMFAVDSSQKYTSVVCSDERSTLYFYKELLHEQFVGNF